MVVHRRGVFHLVARPPPRVGELLSPPHPSLHLSGAASRTRGVMGSRRTRDTIPLNVTLPSRSKPLGPHSPKRRRTRCENPGEPRDRYRGSKGDAEGVLVKPTSLRRQQARVSLGERAREDGNHDRLPRHPAETEQGRRFGAQQRPGETCVLARPPHPSLSHVLVGAIPGRPHGPQRLQVPLVLPPPPGPVLEPLQVRGNPPPDPGTGRGRRGVGLAWCY